MKVLKRIGWGVRNTWNWIRRTPPVRGAAFVALTTLAADGINAVDLAHVEHAAVAGLGALVAWVIDQLVVED